MWAHKKLLWLHSIDQPSVRHTFIPQVCAHTCTLVHRYTRTWLWPLPLWGGFILIIIKTRLSNWFWGKEGGQHKQMVQAAGQDPHCPSPSTSGGIQPLLLPGDAKPDICVGSSPALTSSFLKFVSDSKGKENSCLTFPSYHQFYWKLLKMFNTFSSGGVRWWKHEVLSPSYSSSSKSEKLTLDTKWV